MGTGLIPIWSVIFADTWCTCFGSTYTKIGTIQRRLAWPLRKDDTQNREAFHIFGAGQIGRSGKKLARAGARTLDR